MAATSASVIPRTGRSFREDRRAYDKAQVNEKENFPELLRDLCAALPAEPPRRGRPSLPLRDAIFSITYKVYLGKSTRWSMTDIRNEHGNGYISAVKPPHHNTIINYMGDDRLTPFLLGLIERSARLLKPFEEEFAMDSTGFTTSRLSWSDYKTGIKDRSRQHDCVKVHLACGVRTHVVTAVVIKGPRAGDAPQFPLLLAVTDLGFKIKRIMADKGYCSIENYQLVGDIGAIPFIAFTKNATGAGGGMFSKMFHYLRLYPEEFHNCYHKRSNVEAAFSMMKRKFGGRLRSHKETAMKNETLCKVLCHNIAVLNHAMYSLGVEFDFAHCRLVESREVHGVAA